MVENIEWTDHKTSISIAFNLIIVNKTDKFSASWSVFVAHDVIFSDMKCKSIGTSIVLVFGCILIDYYSRSLNVKFPLTLASLSCSSLIICFPLYALTGNLLLIIISPKNGPTQKLKNIVFQYSNQGCKAIGPTRTVRFSQIPSSLGTWSLSHGAQIRIKSDFWKSDQKLFFSDNTKCIPIPSTFIWTFSFTFIIWARR